MGADGPKRGKRFVVAISGASGIALAVDLLRTAAEHPAVEAIHLVVSNSALRVGAEELDPPATTPALVLDSCRLEPGARDKVVIHPNSDIGASIASGSFPIDGMVVIPCSAGTLASIAHGISRNLVQRAADLMLKQRRPLILALRETPLSLIHAENIVQVTRAGAIVMPPVPSFYAGQNWQAYIAHFTMRVLDLLGVELDAKGLRWE